MLVAFATASPAISPTTSLADAATYDTAAAFKASPKSPPSANAPAPLIKGTTHGGAPTDNAATFNTACPKFDFNTTSGKTYKLVITPIGTITGTVNFDFYDGTTYLFQNYDFTTTKEIYFTDNGSVFGAFDGTQTYSISNFTISVKQVDPNNYWTLGTGWSFGNNKATFDGGSDANLSSSSNVVNGKKYKYNFTITDMNTGSLSFRLGSASTNDLRVTSNGYYSGQAVSDGTSILFRAESGFNGSITNISVTEVLGDKPRIDYTDSLTSPSFLLEPQSTNLLTFSENLKNYENSNTVCTSNYAISPDGTKNATRVDFTASSTNALGVNGAVNNGETITQSVFVKYIDAQFVQLWFGSSGFGGGNTNFDLINGTTSNPSGSSSSMKNMGNGWWRISSTRTATSTASNTGIFKLVVVDSLTSSRFGDEANGSVLAFGGQYEQKSYATSYIPTAGSTVTRAQETCTGAGSASTFNSTEGVLYAEIAALADDGITRRFSISDGTNNNRVLIGFSSSNRFQFVVSDGGSVVVNQLITVSDITEFNKVAISYKLNDCVIWINGQEVGTDTSATMPSGLNTLNFNQGSATENFYGKTKGIYVFNEALTDDELQQLTGPEYNSFAALAAAYNYTVI